MPNCTQAPRALDAPHTSPDDRDLPVSEILQSLQAEFRNFKADVLVGFSEVVNKFGNQEVFLQGDLHQAIRLGAFRNRIRCEWSSKRGRRLCRYRQGHTLQ
jgi:hypothetical protein